jgi:sugar lactone lactonase YvrE
VRRTSKASSAGSNSGRRTTRGSGLAALVLCLCAAACLIPSAAFAAETRPEVESFGSAGSTGSEAFQSPNALAFDQTSKHLYAFDALATKIYGFDASTAATYTPLGGNFPLSVAEGGLIPDLATDSASHHIYYVSTESFALFGFDSAGTPLGGNFPLEVFGPPCGGTVDSSGNVWVGDFGSQAVKEFDSAGNPIGSVDASAQGSPCHVALDSEANLYVSMFEGGTWRYSATSGYTAASEVDSQPGEFTSNPIAVDRASDDLYVVHPSHVSVYDNSGAPLYEFGSSVSGAQYAGIAINQAAGEVYASDAAHGKVEVFGPAVPLPTVTTEDASALATTTATLHGKVNPEGKQLTDCHFDYVTETAFNSTAFTDLSSGGSAPCVPDAASIPADSISHAVSADVSGLTANTTYHFRLVASTVEGAANGGDRNLTTAIGAPTIDQQSVEIVGSTDATLSARINPKGAPTTYHVEYGATASYGQSTPESAPIGFQSDDSNHSVSVHIGGLNPGTAYHFRFVATSLVDKTEGSDTSFATYPNTLAFGPCPNDQFRTGFGSRLSDCRAYEQASPTDKHGANVQGKIAFVQASRAGDRITFYLNGGLPSSGGSAALAPFMASRGPSGWSTDGLLPLLEPGQGAFLPGWSDDLGTTLVGGSRRGGVDDILYLRDSGTAAYQVVLSSSEELSATRLAGYAADTSHLIFEAQAALLSEAAAGGEENLYDLSNGTLTLPGRIPVSPATSCDDVAGPACVPSPTGAFAGAGITAKNALSRDGSKVFFTDRASKQLYVREDATKTTEISTSQKTNGSGPGGSDPFGPSSVVFRGATPDGAHAFFTDSEELTNDANTGVGPAIGRANLDGTGGNQGFVPLPAAAGGVAVDGSHVYWANPAAGTIGRANLDGTGVDQSFITGASNPQYVAVDGSHIYWTNAATGANGAGTIGRANLDGTSPSQSFIGGASNPQGIAVDGAFLYWANAGTTEATRAIGRANLDGTSPDQSFVAIEGVSGPSGVAVNASFVYWTSPGSGNEFGGSLKRAPITGGPNLESVVSSGLSVPRGLTLDGSFLYWADNNGTFLGPGVGRVKLDGSELRRTFVRTTGTKGVAVDGGHIYWSGGDGRDTGNDLYRYAGASGGLVDLSVDPGVSPKGADVQGFLGASDDGSYVYFVANGVLAPGASPGGCKEVEGGFDCVTNLYVSHAGATTFLAQFDSEADANNWSPGIPKTSRVADDGTLVFSSDSFVDLSGHDHGSACAGPCGEFYRYSPSEEGLLCITCIPTGTPPSGNSLGTITGVFLLSAAPHTTIIARNLSADGNRFFFESHDALLSTDINSVGDVYEWEAKGSGSCESKSQDGGCLYLVSSGTSPDPSHFADASANGDHVFFFTDQQLVPGDRDQLEDVYDAGVGGGLPSQHTLAPPTCAGAACQANPAPPSDQPVSSAIFSGPGNAHKPSSARKCPKGKRKVRSAGKVRCQKTHKTKQHKRHSNRGGSK